jgi:hypothetical protein
VQQPCYPRRDFDEQAAILVRVYHCPADLCSRIKALRSVIPHTALNGTTLINKRLLSSLDVRQLKKSALRKYCGTCFCCLCSNCMNVVLCGAAVLERYSGCVMRLSDNNPIRYSLCNWSAIKAGILSDGRPIFGKPEKFEVNETNGPELKKILV